MVKIQKKRLIILCESSPTKVFSFVHEIQKWTHSSIFAFVELAASQHFLQATHNPLGYPDPVAKHVLTQRLHSWVVSCPLWVGAVNPWERRFTSFPVGIPHFILHWAVQIMEPVLEIYINFSYVHYLDSGSVSMGVFLGQTH